MNAYTGIVERYNPKSGYGFIVISAELRQRLNLADNRNLFFHATGIVGGNPKPTLLPGDEVSFQVLETKKGPQAYHVFAEAERVPQRRD